MRDLQYQIDVMTAFRDGKRVECMSKFYNDDLWAKILPEHQFDWSLLDYRIVPEKPREWTLFQKNGHMEVCNLALEDCATCRVLGGIRVREVLPE